MSPNVLDHIATRTAERINIYKSKLSIHQLKNEPFYNRKPLSLAKVLNTSASTPRIIAEVKFASPSEGFLRGANSASPAEAVNIANSYLKAGAAAISILTEPEYFSGDIEFLKAVRRANDEAVLLMKDFVIDTYQLELARACGADVVLLIASLLNDRLHEFIFSARALGLSALVEVHDEKEAQEAIQFKAELIGVNNRSLRTLKTDIETSKRLAGIVCAKATGVCESGLKTREQIDELMELGYKGFLIGSSFMKSDNPGAALKTLLL